MFTDFQNIQQDIDNQSIQFSGVSYFPLLNLDSTKAKYKIYKVKDSEIYRPDKVSYSLYGVTELSWTLDVINNFTQGFIEYEKGREIKYLSLSDLQELGIS